MPGAGEAARVACIWRLLGPEGISFLIGWSESSDRATPLLLLSGPPHVFAEAHIERSLRAVEGKVIDMTMVGTKNNSASEGGELSEVWSFHAGSALSCTAASPDGAFIALGTETGVILATVGIPEKEGSLTPQLLAHYPGEPTSALAFAPPRGKNEPSGLLVAGTKAGSIRLLSVEPSFKELKVSAAPIFLLSSVVHAAPPPPPPNSPRLGPGTGWLLVENGGSLFFTLRRTAANSCVFVSS